jgi:hypothetical protein
MKWVKYSSMIGIRKTVLRGLFSAPIHHLFSAARIRLTASHRDEHVKAKAGSTARVLDLVSL